jgi:amidase/aspartyl-tRNA(Asn)/glutamyl-tRNA(Gln) amidotransferase subunit A
MPAVELGLRIRRREVSPVEVVDAFLARIAARNTEINAYVTVVAEEARERARCAERALSSGEVLGPLHGLPVAIKDLNDLKAGVRNTFGCKVFADYVPDTTAVNVERVERAGGIVLGKTNTPEFGHKGVTDNPLVGPTCSPFGTGKNAGGSSGGSAAAVGAGMAALALGSDAGGSIRIPAALSGVYGFKASYERVASASRPDAFHSVTPFSQSGPLARSVEDAALLLSVVAGPHERDPLSLPTDGTDYLAATRAGVRGLKIAYSPDLDVFLVEPAVAGAVADAARVFESLGARVEPVRVGLQRSSQELCELWYRESGVRNAATFERYRQRGIDLLGEHREEITPELVEIIERALRMRAVDYKLDEGIRTEVFDAVQDVLDRYDLLVCPTVAVVSVDNASNRNTLGPSQVNGQPVNPLLGWCLTYPFNFSGHPAASIPAAFTDDGLPIGMQIVGRRFADTAVLAASAAFERARPWQERYPR